MLFVQRMRFCFSFKDDDDLSKPENTEAGCTWVLVREPQHWARCTLPPSSGSTARSFPGKINIKCLSGSSCDDDPYFIISFHNLTCSSTTPLLEHITNKGSKTRWVVWYFTSTRLMSSSRKLSSFCSCSSCCKQNRKTYKYM